MRKKKLKMESTAGVARRLSTFVKSVILHYSACGLSSIRIQRILEINHHRKTSRQSIRLFLKRYNESGNTKRKPNAMCPRTKIQPVHKDFINMWIAMNNEITADEISEKLKTTFGISISREYISTIRRNLGWAVKRIKYCQMITHKNKLIRMDWALNAFAEKEAFLDVIFVDESTVEMSSNGRLFFFHPGSNLDRLPAKAAKPKHSYKVHIWGGISYRGRTPCCVFTGIMDSTIYQQILHDNFLPFVDRKFPDGYRLYQDNDSKHKSKSTQKWMEEQSMLDKVMTTLASSPDLNPIENVWSALKDFLQREIKPKKKDELVSGIRQFWESLSTEKCGRYIDHIHRVIPQVILNNGGPTNF